MKWCIFIDGPGNRTSIYQILDFFEDGGYRVAPVRYGTAPSRVVLLDDRSKSAAWFGGGSAMWKG